MKNSTLFFRSLAVILFLAGSAHLFSYSVEKNRSEALPEKTEGTSGLNGVDGPLDPQQEKTVNEFSTIEQKSSIAYDPETDYIIGKWKVAYDSGEFKGSIIYDLKKEGGIFNAYTYRYEDPEGNGEKAESAKTLAIQVFDGYKGKGVYMIEYEGVTYDVACQIDMVDENTFKLSYDYHGYGDIETWKRL